MLYRIYYWFHRVSAKPEERGEYSAGVWQDRVRIESLKLCRDSKGRFLEIGCGEGLFLAKLASVNKDNQVYGVDNRQDLLQRAVKKIKEKDIKNAKLFQADATLLPFKDSYFDLIVCINVIFNLQSLDIVKKVLKEMVRVCKSGGRIIFDFRNSTNPFIYFKYKLAPYYDRTINDLPLKTYSLKDIYHLLDKINLKVTKQISVGFPIKRIAPIIILETKRQ